MNMSSECPINTIGIRRRQVATPKSALITREYKGLPFVFREDGYFNMTKAAQHFEKEVKEFLRLPSTLEYTEALSETVGISHLLDVKPGRNGGTYGHPKLAVFFARWLDVRFSIWCDAVITDILTKKADLTVTQPEASAVVAVSKAGMGLDMASQLAQAVLQSVDAVRLLDALPGKVLTTKM